MTTFNFDEITVDYLITSGISERMRWSSYQPGGEHFTIENARRWAVGEMFDISVLNGYSAISTIINDTMLIVKTDSSIDRAGLIAIMDAEIINNSKTYVFSGIDSGSDMKRDYDGEYDYHWTELRFKIKE